jgi:hypothetical protein
VYVKEKKIYEEREGINKKDKGRKVHREWEKIK